MIVGGAQPVGSMYREPEGPLFREQNGLSRRFAPDPPSFISYNSYTPIMSNAQTDALHTIREEWRERLRTASDRAAQQVDGMDVADLRALRATIREELDALKEQLPEPIPLEGRGPMTTDEQANHVRTALQYNALQVREQVVHYELRRRALGPDLEVPPKTKKYAEVAWEAMGGDDVNTVPAVYREVAHRIDGDLHLSTVEKWLRQKNPHHPEEHEGSWTELRRAVLLASTSF